jgi:hypothetical protein
MPSDSAPPNGPDYGTAPPHTPPPPPFGVPPFLGIHPFHGMPAFGGMAYGSPYPAAMHAYGMPTYPIPAYSTPGMDIVMSQVMDRAAFMHRFMIMMSNMAAEMSRACLILAQSPSQLGMPLPGGPTAATAAPSTTVPGDKPVDLGALKQALAGMDPVQAQKTLYAVQMMEWYGSLMRGGSPLAGEGANSKAW